MDLQSHTMDCEGVSADFELRHRPGAVMRCEEWCVAREEARVGKASSRYCKKKQERGPREERGLRMRPSMNLARTGDQDPPEGRRRSPKVRPPAGRAEQPRTV